MATIAEHVANTTPQNRASFLSVLGIHIEEQCSPINNASAAYVDLIEFLAHLGRPKLSSPFLFKVQGRVQKYAESLISWKRLDLKAIAADSRQLRSNLRSEPYSLTSDNAGTYFLEIDMISANFTALKLISQAVAEESIDMSLDWPSWFRSFMPMYDERSQDERRRQNQLISPLGPLHPIPAIIYESKTFRQKVFGPIGKTLSPYYELHMLRLVQALEAESWFAALPKHIGTDDIIIRLESREQGEQVLEQLRQLQTNPTSDLAILFAPEVIALKLFQLSVFGEGEPYADRSVLKTYTDSGQLRTLNVPPRFTLSAARRLAALKKQAQAETPKKED